VDSSFKEEIKNGRNPNRYAKSERNTKEYGRM
jgi:hypothetical protein